MRGKAGLASTARVTTRCNLKNNGYRHTIHLIFSGGGWLGWPALRASTEHSIRLGPERINPECAVREHNGQPCRPAPLSCVRDARAREAAWPPYARSCVRDARARGLARPPRLSARGVLPSGWV